jgi:hypothetical protein
MPTSEERPKPQSVPGRRKTKDGLEKGMMKARLSI